MDIVINRRLRLIGWLLFILCVVWCVWILVSAIITSQETGILYVRSSNSQAGLIISQNDRQALAIGIGVAKVRLEPGSYQVSASIAGKQANSIVEVYKKHTTSSYLNPSQSVRLPSIDTVNFVGFSNFLNYGMSSSQLNNLEQAFFQYSKSIKTVAVNTASISPAPHNPNSASTMSTVSFKVTVDSTSYNAVMNYDNLGDDYSLYLYNPSNNSLVFNSGATSTPGGD